MSDFDDMDAALSGGEQVKKARARDPFPGKSMVINGDEVPPGRWRYINGMADDYGLPPDCPVKPLGFDGDVFYFVTARGTLGHLTDAKSGKGHIRSLFAGRINFLIWAFGSGSENQPDRFNADVAANILLQAAAEKGAWDPMNKVRGRGAHLSDQGKLIYHMGHRVMVDQARHACGEHGPYFYPSRASLLTPADRPEPPSPGNAGDIVIQDLSTWSFFRSELDCMLLLGWIATAIFGGALEWRPAAFISATHGSGKSTLQRYIRGLMGQGFVDASNTTSAGIYQTLGNDTVPILIDEIENGMDERRVKSIVELARISASGDKLRRGGADHTAKEFTLRSSFMMSAINPPSMRPQDASRFVFFNIREIKDMSKRPDLDPARLSALGRRIIRRMVDRWQDYQHAIERYAKLFELRTKMSAREVQQYAPLAAAHDMLMYDGPVDDVEIAAWAGNLEQVLVGDRAARRENWLSCLRQLLDHPMDAFRTEKYHTIGELLNGKLYPGKRGDAPSERLAFVHERIAQFGMAITFPKGKNLDFAAAKLFIPNEHPVLVRVFDGTDWNSVAGTNGAWAHTFKFGPKKVIETQKRVRAAGALRYGTTIALSGFMSFDQREGE